MPGALRLAATRCLGAAARRKHLPAPGPDVLVLRCGPGPMNKVVEAALGTLGYTNGQQFQF